MSHHHKRFKAESNGQADLIVDQSLYSRKPPTFSWVSQQEYHIMLFDQLFEFIHFFNDFLDGFIIVANGVAWHWNLHLFTSRLHWREDLWEPFGSYEGFEVVLLLRVFKGKQALSHWVGVRHLPIVNKGDLPIPPRQQISSHLTAKRAWTKEETACLLEGLQIQGRDHSPLHQLQVQIYCVLSNYFGVKLLFQTHFQFLHFNLLIDL